MRHPFQAQEDNETMRGLNLSITAHLTPHTLLHPSKNPTSSKPPNSHQISNAIIPENYTNSKPFLLHNCLSLAVALTLTSPLPCPAIPSLNSLSQSSQLPPPTTPFSQSKNLQLGLENGKIRPCPSLNPGCVSTNPKSSFFSFPWTIPDDSIKNSVQRLEDAILKTQKNAKIQVDEETPNGRYIQAEVDGVLFGRDVLEFLVNKDVVSYRCMATKVTYVYPFTTAIGDSKGQEERMKKIIDELGWYAPSFESMD